MIEQYRVTLLKKICALKRKQNHLSAMNLCNWTPEQ